MPRTIYRTPIHFGVVMLESVESKHPRLIS